MTTPTMTSRNQIPEKIRQVPAIGESWVFENKNLSCTVTRENFRRHKVIIKNIQISLYVIYTLTSKIT